jgi:hypothetical protein
VPRIGFSALSLPREGGDAPLQAVDVKETRHMSVFQNKKPNPQDPALSDRRFRVQEGGGTSKWV